MRVPAIYQCGSLGAETTRIALRYRHFPASHLRGAIGAETTSIAARSRGFPASHLFGTIGQFPLITPRPIFANEMANFVRWQIGVNPYPDKLPQADTSYPLLSFTIFDGDNDLLLSGPSGLTYRGVQFDAWSPIQTDAQNVSEQLWGLFKQFTGMMGRIQVANVTRHPVKSFSYPPVNGGDGNTMYRFMNEYKFWYFG